MKKMFLVLLFSLPIMAWAGSHPTDSVTVKKIDGKNYIQYKVGKGEGLLSICRKYGVSKEEVLAANKGLSESLKLGQIILVPVSGNKPQVQAQQTPVSSTKISVNESHADADSEKPAEQLVTDNKKESHVVQAGETLYKISRMYNISEANLKAWNNLSNGELKLGQKLWLKAQPANSSTGAAVSATGASRKDSVKFVPVVAKPREEPHPMAASASVKTVQESGTAFSFESEDMSGGRMLALHKTAPPGTIIKLTNPVTNKTVFVRVVGQLPNTDENKNVLIKISKTTADKIGMRDEKAQLKLDYSLD